MKIQDYMEIFILFMFIITFQINAQKMSTVDSIDYYTTWAGWRGLEREGKIFSNNVFATSNILKSIKWQKAIPGRGHSSPIVHGNNVFVSTTYESTKHKIIL